MSAEIDAALNKLDVRYRTQDFLKSIGASPEVAELLAAHPDVAAKFKWDGVSFTFNGGDLPAVNDPAAKDYFANGPLKSLFAVAEADAHNDAPVVDPVLLASARAGNRTAYARLVRDSFGGDVKALDAMLADKGNGNEQVANGHSDKTPDEFSGSKNPFLKLRKPDGTLDKATEARVAAMVRAMGHRKVAEIARAAKSPAAPLGLSISGMPLKA
jgi:hypothetical protein